MRRAVILTGWAWFAVALPQVTNTGVDFFVSLGLLLTGPVIGLAWVVYSTVSPAVFRERRWAWLSVPALGIAPLILGFTGWGLLARLTLSEPALLAFAEDTLAGRAEVRPPAERWVGLFRVWATATDDDEVVLMTGFGFLECYGLAYRPSGPPEEDGRHHRHQHLRGPWYRYVDRL